MGLDGGTVVTRSDVLRGQSWRVAKNDNSRSTRGGNVTRVPHEGMEKNVERATAWTTCALSSQPLRPPIVVCGLGRLYNKDAVLQFLLCRRASNRGSGSGLTGAVSGEAMMAYANQLRVAAGGLDHITSLRDLLDVHLTTATPAASSGGAQGAGPSGASSAVASAAPPGGGAPAAPFVCPITHLPCDRHPCSALRPCGHVLSDRALRNLSGDTVCPVCGAAFTATLPILGTPEQVEALRERIKAAAEAKESGGKAAGSGGGAAHKRKRARAADAVTEARTCAEAGRGGAANASGEGGSVGGLDGGDERLGVVPG